MVTSKRITLINKEHYRVDLEYNDMYAILHLPSVSKFTKSVYLDMLETIKGIREFIDTIGYSGLWVAIETSNDRMGKLVDRLGFKYLGESDGHYVYQHEGDV